MQGNHDVTKRVDERANSDCLITVFGPWCGLLARYWAKKEYATTVARRAAKSFPNEIVKVYDSLEWDEESMEMERRVLLELQPATIA